LKDARPRQPQPPLSVLVPFLMGRMRLSVSPRPGAAPRVPFDRASLEWPASATWIGHASVLVTMDGVRFAVDPIFSHRCSPVQFAGPPRLVPPGVSLDDLPPLDFVLLSHDHYDHTDRATVRALAARGIPFYVPTGMGTLLEGFGARAHELGWWDHVTVKGVDVWCVPAQHFSGRGLGDRDRRLWAGFVVRGSTRSFYQAGDTGFFDGFREIGSRLGPFDLAAVPIGAYLPEAMMKRVHVNPEEALQAAQDAGAHRTLAMHFGTFDLADEPLDEPPRRFQAEAQRRGLGPDRAWVMSVGESRPF
jgi:N-acyl-phosphatidylethanolamine-hydrolysing phospholipase D